MKNKIEVEKIKIVTKDNFQSELKEFKKLLNSNLFECIIINNDFSTSSTKSIQEKENEIIFSEFTICRKQNLASKDIHYTFTTFLVPAIKFHRYSNDEIVSFSSIFLKYLANEKSVYDFNLINASNSLSYDNIHKRKEFENTLNMILIDGKPSKKENKASYLYYPKAFHLPSKKFRNRFEELVKFYIELYFDKNAEKKIDEDKNIILVNDKYINDYKLLNFFLNFKWGLVLDKVDSEMFKVYVNEYKIKFKNKEFGDIASFLDFVRKLKNFFDDDKNTTDKFEIDIRENDQNGLDEEILQNWKQYLLAEENILEFNYSFNDKNKINICIKADKKKENKNFKNVTTFLNAIISIPEELKIKDEIQIKSIFYRRIDMKNLFPKKFRNNLEFYYHPVAKVDDEKLKKNIQENNIKDYLKKVSYNDLFLKKKNDEEILFGYRFEPQLKQLFDIKRDIPITKTISLEFGRDLEILINNERFIEQIKKSFSEFKIEKEDKSFNSRTMHLNLRNEIDFKDEKTEILNIAKEIKKNLLLDEEIGVSYFYDEIFKKEGINIYGTNLKNKLYFPIGELLLKPEDNKEEEIQKILEKVNIYDISYICYQKNVDFYKKYIEIKKTEQYKERTMTLRLGYVIEEMNVLKNEDILNELKNKFYLDLETNKYCIKCEKEKFYDNVDEIFRVMKNKCDFIINKRKNDSNYLELNVIDKDKFKNIDELTQEINKIIS